MELYQHSQTAYEAAHAMLDTAGKAAVIHPTGTGKSFIGFRLCEDHPFDTVLWLSPSAYIFQTQTENWVKAGGGALCNVRFLTYAKLMLLDEEALADLQPHFVVLDEFHRCGAQLWGQGVKRLLARYPKAKLLGLTATNIRYLDNQRDMALELFDGNVASEITLGEAIMRGILNPPKYVLSVYSYQKDIARLSEKIRRTGNRALRDEAETYLEALRRALEMADGLDVVFEKHMTQKHGKYIVFCASADHMREMMELSQEWFGRVDRSPHIYSVYASDPSASQSFADFKADRDEEHLKLLYCIDALNEGIHLEDIDGVILLRPTVSPIVFKQQIGRALSAGKKKDAVIFDIVLNISNLCSIGAVEEEMQTAAAYYRSLGGEDAVVREHFQIIDEVKDCRLLFEKLGEVLTISWPVMYEQALAYYRENGDLEVSARYVTEDGYSLGHWIYNQRYIRKGVLDGALTDEQIAKLDALGMRWEVRNDTGWEKNFAAAQRYFEENGNLDVPVKYVTDEGISLGQWLATVRTWERSGVHAKYLTGERKGRLDEIGMIWDKTDHIWERSFAAARTYYEIYGHLDVPADYVDADGIRLGAWIGRQRRLYKEMCGCPQEAVGKTGRNLKSGTKAAQTCELLSQEQIRRLEAIGMIWKKRTDRKWERAFSVAELYAKAHGNLLVPAAYESCGVKLGSWVQRQRLLYRKGTLAADRIRRLEGLGMVWDTEPWMVRFRLAEQYYRENGTLNIPQSKVADGCWLGKWIVTQKRLRDEGKLTPEQQTLLGRLPLEQVGTKDARWYRIYEDAAAWYQKNGDLMVPQGYAGASGCRLSDWMARQRRSRRLGELPEDKIRLLDAIGFVWKKSRTETSVAGDPAGGMIPETERLQQGIS